MRVAIIDMGTNTFHLLIAEVKERGQHTVLDKLNIFVKIGEGGISEGIITQAACERALKTLQAFREKIDEWQCDEIYATATSAIRNARNGADLLRQIERQTRIQVQIIDGNTEAELIYYGVKSVIDIEGTSLIMDIGGGSVEFICCNREQILWKRSFEIGAQRLLYLFHQQDPIPSESIATLEEYLDRELDPLIQAAGRLNPETLIGSSGSFDTLCEIYYRARQLSGFESTKEFELPIEIYKQIHHQLIAKNRAERLVIPGMLEHRVDMIVVASCLINFVVKKLDVNRIRVSTAALKEGILYNVLSKAR